MKAVLAGGEKGGHLTPPLALAQALRDAEPSVELLLVGARRGIEAELLPRQPFRHRLLPIEPIYRRAWWRNARWLWLPPRVWGGGGGLLAAKGRPALDRGGGRYARADRLGRARPRPPPPPPPGER